MERALEALPDADALAPLREALIALSQADQALAWAASGDYATLDKRLAALDVLEARVPELAEQVRERAERVFRHAVAALRALEEGEAAAAARALVAAGEAEEAERRFEQAESFFEKARELGRRARDRTAEALALRRLARVARARGELERAHALYRQSYEIAEAMGDVEGIVVACQGLGNVHVDRGLWEPARAWYARGLERIAHAPPSRLHWQLYNNLAIVALRTGDLAQSEGWLERMREAIETTGDEVGIAYLENGRGQLLLARGRFAEAEAAYRRAVAGADDARARTHYLLNLGAALLRQARLPDAERAVRQAEELAITRRVVDALPEAYRALGSIARARGDANGFLFFEQALETCRTHRLPEVQLAATQHEYGLWEEAMGQAEAAAARFAEAMNIYRQLGFRMEMERAAADLARLAPGAAPGAGPD